MVRAPSEHLSILDWLHHRYQLPDTKDKCVALWQIYLGILFDFRIRQCKSVATGSSVCSKSHPESLPPASSTKQPSVSNGSSGSDGSFWWPIPSHFENVAEKSLIDKLITHIKATSKQWFSLLYKDKRLFHRMRWFRRRIPVQHSIHGAIPRLEWIADWSRQKSVQSTHQAESKSLLSTRLSQHETLSNASKKKI